MGRQTLTIAGLLLALLLFLLLNVAGNALMTGSRLDLTENHLYTLSDGSRSIVAGLPEPVTLTYYFTEAVAADQPQIRTYAQRVRGLLDEFVSAGRGKVRLVVRDPEPFSEEEDAAVSARLQGMLIDAGSEDRLYFGLVATGATDERETVPFFDPGREASLEYDIARIIAKLGHPERPVLALVSSLPVAGMPAMPFPGAPPGQPAWFAIDQLKDLFDVRTVEPTATTLPEGSSLLLVIHPKFLSDGLLYAMDQFVLKGGHALVFTDPLCEREEVPHDPGNQFAALMADRSSNLDRLYRTWGLEMVPGKIVGDRGAAMQVRAGTPSRPEAVHYVAWLGLDSGHFDKQDFVTSQLGSLVMPSVGSLRPVEGATTEFLPLIVSSQDAAEMDVTSVQFMPDPKKLLAGFQPTGQTYTLAARVRGSAKTAFPEGRPKADKPADDPADPAAGDDAAGDDAAEAAADGPDPDFVAESQGAINVIAVADADMLWDEWWVQVQNFFGQRLAIPSASNGDFLVNAMDNLAGSNDLISVRSRARFERPFERVVALQKDAEQRFREKEQALQQKLQETDQRLAELQKQKADGSSLILSPEQRTEIDRFRDEQVATRKQLRDVNHDLRKDIDSLEMRIKFVNIGLVPLAVLVLAVGLGGWRSRRRRD